MKAIIILDQMQAGLGGKERADTPLGGQRVAMGSADTTEKALAKNAGKLLGTFYCGTAYYTDNRELVQRKFTKMAEQMGADVVLIGPTYDYPEFAQMACELAAAFQTQTTIPAIAAIAEEKNADLIAQYKDQLTIVKAPKKGGTGLSDAVDHLAEGAALLAAGKDISEFKANYCY
ncbi:GrdB-related putative oxidoreductase [Lacticaseibacillus jixianensis]|uniref:GrdB-related putative oxidoreductase n=1 Tax=Lacticaseibacillus jixianensis TaxID=2486012 RepID=A0ABW4B8S8_9LACO|nr:GrdB-related putative oxidoreductase [Lacticaseibacillus jixianensis]